MEVTSESVNGVAVLRPIGKIDSGTSKTFEESVQACIAEGHTKLVLNFERCDFLSSTGIRILLLAAKHAKAHNGATVICGLNEYLQSLFSIAGLGVIFPIVKTEAEALAKCSAA